MLQSPNVCIFRCNAIHTRSAVSKALFSHDNALLIVLIDTAMLLLLADLCRAIRQVTAASGRPDGCNALLGALVASVSRFDIPHVGLEDVAPAADAHLGEVTHSILRFYIT